MVCFLLVFQNLKVIAQKFYLFSGIQQKSLMMNSSYLCARTILIIKLIQKGGGTILTGVKRYERKLVFSSETMTKRPNTVRYNSN